MPLDDSQLDVRNMTKYLTEKALNYKPALYKNCNHYLRRQAMERRVTIGSLANAVVDSQDLLG